MTSQDPETHRCNKCGGEAELRCGRCRSAWYCSQVCQRADYPDHRTLCRMAADGGAPGAGSSGTRTAPGSANALMDLLPPDFAPMRYLRCMDCGRVTLVCTCRRSSPVGHDLCFVMPPIPAQCTFRQRISRWALLVKHHPLLSVFDAVRYVQDRPSSLESDMEFVKPIIAGHMEQYKQESFGDLADKLQVLPEHRVAFVEKTKEDADNAMNHFFAGNWGYLTIFEYSLLYNAFNVSGPEDHDSATYPRFLVVWGVLNTIMDAYQAAGVRDPNFRLEDLENVVY